jgi:hypothetical protein
MLMEGMRLHRSFSDQYHRQKKSPGFDEETYFIEAQGKFIGWSNDVIALIRGNLPDHYLFHFIEPEIPAINRLGYPKALSNLLVTFQYTLRSLEEVILRIEDKMNLMIRQEIAEAEHLHDAIYRITYSEHTRQIKLNEILLSKPDFSSENELFFAFIFANSGRPVTKSEIESVVGEPLKKRIVDIVRDLGFKDEIKKVFFPVVKLDAVMFINPITRKYAVENDLPIINFRQIKGNG